MEIDRVELSDFRNYRSLSLTPAPHLNVLAGPNAQGKTNLLEGLGVLLVGRSFRGAKAGDMLGWGAPTAFVGGELRRGETVRVIRRAVVQREDGRWGVGGEGCPWARAIGFGWQDLAIPTEGPQARRNFIDGFAGKLYAAHLSGLARYRQIVARRNHLLQGGLAGAGLRNALAPWNEQLARVGPHRDDLLIEVDGRDLRLYGSRGQQRLMALTLRLAEVGPVARAVGSAPVLLLDDALSELDPQVQERVLEHVSTAGQVFLTTADAALPEVRRATWWDVRGGRVTDPRLSHVRGAA